MRLEARHMGASGDFFEDATRLGTALNRVPTRSSSTSQGRCIAIARNVQSERVETANGAFGSINESSNS